MSKSDWVRLGIYGAVAGWCFGAAVGIIQRSGANGNDPSNNHDESPTLKPERHGTT